MRASCPLDSRHPVSVGLQTPRSPPSSAASTKALEAPVASVMDVYGPRPSNEWSDVGSLLTTLNMPYPSRHERHIASPMTPAVQANPDRWPPKVRDCTDHSSTVDHRTSVMLPIPQLGHPSPSTAAALGCNPTAAATRNPPRHAGLHPHDHKSTTTTTTMAATVAAPHSLPWPLGQYPQDLTSTAMLSAPVSAAAATHSPPWPPTRPDLGGNGVMAMSPSSNTHIRGRR